MLGNLAISGTRPGSSDRSGGDIAVLGRGALDDDTVSGTQGVRSCLGVPGDGRGLAEADLHEGAGGGEHVERVSVDDGERPGSGRRAAGGAARSSSEAACKPAA